MVAYIRMYVLETRNLMDYQESLLREFVKQQRFSGFDICVDDGWSNTNLTDPASSILDQAILLGFALIALDKQKKAEA